MMTDMCVGIAVAGLNGSGKTTFGSHLATMLGYDHLDAEDYYFHASGIPYANPRSKTEASELLLADIKKCGRFILSAVNCDFGEDINAMYRCVIYLKAPLTVRLNRIKERSFYRFGARVLKDGDMYEKEQAFYNFVAARTMKETDEWLQSIKCPIIYLDGTEPVADNVKLVKEQILNFMNYQI